VTGESDRDARLAQLKKYALLHARAQGLPMRRVRQVLGRIHDDREGSPRSWAAVWNGEGDALARRGRQLHACRAHVLARFPYPGDRDRSRAQRLGVETFDRWRLSRGGIERLELRLPGGTVCCWAAGLSSTRPRPLVVVSGGIVSVKEQWAPLLPKLAGLGLAAVVTEFPGVGENTVRYTADSWRLLPDLLDRVAGRARVADTSLLALSFSGHLALRAATADSRIRRILTVGAPVREYFTDERWSRRIPGITLETLCCLTGVPDPDRIHRHMRGWALTDRELAAVRIPVAAVVSSRDGIIPPDDYRVMRSGLPDVRFKHFEDVHGSPGHLLEMRSWLLSTLLLLRGVGGVRARMLGGVVRAAALGDALGRTTARVTAR